MSIGDRMFVLLVPIVKRLFTLYLSTATKLIDPNRLTKTHRIYRLFVTTLYTRLNNQMRTKTDETELKKFPRTDRFALSNEREDEDGRTDEPV